LPASTGIGTLLAVAILSIPTLGTETVSKALEWVFMALIPNFCLGQSVSDFYSNFMYLNACRPFIPLCPLICPAKNFTCCRGIADISVLY